MNRKTWLMVDALVIITMVVLIVKEVKRNHHVVEPPMISHQEMVLSFKDEVKVNWKAFTTNLQVQVEENDGVADADTVNPHLPEQTSFALEMEAANARALRAGGR